MVDGLTPPVENAAGLHSLSREALGEALAALGQPAYRAGQLFGWLHARQAGSLAEMGNLPAALRQALAARYAWELPVVQLVQHSADGTAKYLLRLGDGNCVEAVLMQYKHGHSLCISSQVGCRMGCRFCASTQGGLVRSLTAGEMAGELYAVQRHSGARVGHIVLMGIGEPLDNFDNVLRFLQTVNHPEGQRLSLRNISLSTCGLVPQIRRLAAENLAITLSVSLHAGDDEGRSALMPVNDAWPIAELLAACRDYQRATGRRVSYEYALARGRNDSPRDVERLAGLLRGMGAHVNLIPLNPVDGSPYTTSDEQAVHAFQKALTARGINATVRRRLGTDIAAACGQLRAEQARVNGTDNTGADG